MERKEISWIILILVTVATISFFIGFEVKQGDYESCMETRSNCFGWAYSCENQLQRCSECFEHSNQSECDKVCSYEGWQNWMQDGEGKEIWLK